MLNSKSTTMKKKAYFIVALLVVSAAAHSQVFEKSIGYNGDGDFIRRKSDTEWLFAVKHFINDQKTHNLTLMNATGTSFPSMALDDIEDMYDLEVEGNRAYFIGTSYSVYSGNFFGIVPLNTFPNSTVEVFRLDAQPYCVMPVPGQFVYKVYIAMPAPNPAYGYCFVEAYNYPPSPNWNFNINWFTQSNYKVDDIAVTTNQVVFSVRDVTTNDGYFFTQPRVPDPNGPTPRNVSAVMYKVTSTAYSRLLVEAATGDTVYIVHGNDINNRTIAVHKYATGGTHIASRLLNGPSGRFNSMEALDLTYDNQYKILSVLSSFVVAGTYNDLIWHISNGQMLSGGPVYGHTFSESIASFDHLQGTSRNIIAIGNLSGPIYQTGIFRLRDDNDTASCLSVTSSSFTQLSPASGNPSIEWTPYPVTYPKETVSKTTGTTTVSNICPQK